MKVAAPSNLNRMPGEVPALPIAPHTQEPPTMNTPSPAHIAAALRTLYLYLCARRLDTATAVVRAGAALSTADLTAGRVASLPEFAADMHALSLADILRNLIAYGLGAHPVAALESTAHFHARNISSSDEMCAHHTTQEQLHRELAHLVRGALSEPADTSDMCGAYVAPAGRAWVCTRGAHADGLHVEHRRDGAPVAIWESAEGSK